MYEAFFFRSAEDQLQRQIKTMGDKITHMCTYAELDELTPTLEEDEINFDMVNAALGNEFSCTDL